MSSLGITMTNTGMRTVACMCVVLILAVSSVALAADGWADTVNYGPGIVVLDSGHGMTDRLRPTSPHVWDMGVGTFRKAYYWSKARAEG